MQVLLHLLCLVTLARCQNCVLQPLKICTHGRTYRTPSTELTEGVHPVSRCGIVVVCSSSRAYVCRYINDNRCSEIIDTCSIVVQAVSDGPFWCITEPTTTSTPSVPSFLDQLVRHKRFAETTTSTEAFRNDFQTTQAPTTTTTAITPPTTKRATTTTTRRPTTTTTTTTPPELATSTEEHSTTVTIAEGVSGTVGAASAASEIATSPEEPSTTIATTEGVSGTEEPSTTSVAWPESSTITYNTTATDSWCREETEDTETLATEERTTSKLTTSSQSGEASTTTEERMTSVGPTTTLKTTSAAEGTTSAISASVIQSGESSTTTEQSMTSTAILSTSTTEETTPTTTKQKIIAISDETTTTEEWRVIREGTTSIPVTTTTAATRPLGKGNGRGRFGPPSGRFWRRRGLGRQKRGINFSKTHLKVEPKKSDQKTNANLLR